MRKLLLALCALCFVATPAVAATSSADLEAIAKVLEQNPVGNKTLNSQLLSLVREPAKTLDGITLPSTAAQYTTTIDTALKLRPKGWIAGATEQYPPASSGDNCTAILSYWTASPPAGLRADAFAWGKGNCASVLSAGIARAWAWRLRQIGR